MFTEHPTRAASKCSVVWISTSPFANVVLLSVLLTKLNNAGISTTGSKSILRNYKKLSLSGDGNLDTSSLIKLLL